MSTLNDEEFVEAARKHATTLADAGYFMDLVGDRIELLMEDLKRAEESAKGYQEELARDGDEHSQVVNGYRESLRRLGADLEAVIEIALAAGVDPVEIRAKVKSKIALDKASAPTKASTAKDAF